MIGYTSIGTNDLEKAADFYDQLLSLLEAKPFFKTDRGVGWGVSPSKPMFSVMKPFNGEVATFGNGGACQDRCRPCHAADRCFA